MEVPVPEPPDELLEESPEEPEEPAELEEPEPLLDDELAAASLAAPSLLPLPLAPAPERLSVR